MKSEGYRAERNGCSLGESRFPKSSVSMLHTHGLILWNFDQRNTGQAKCISYTEQQPYGTMVETGYSEI